MADTDVLFCGLSATKVWEGPVWKLRLKGYDRKMPGSIFRSSRDSFFKYVPCKYLRISYWRLNGTHRCVTSIPDPANNRAGNGAGHRQAGFRPAFFVHPAVHIKKGTIQKIVPFCFSWYY